MNPNLPELLGTLFGMAIGILMRLAFFAAILFAAIAVIRHFW